MNGYTGRIFEEEVLGEIHLSWDGDGYMTYNKALEYVKENQEWDPTDPDTRTANDLHALTALDLEIKDWNKLLLYNAVSSPLDYYHGVDCFFEFEGEIVTIDLTVNPSKVIYKADLVLHPDDLEKKGIKNIAHLISCMFQKRCKGGI